MKAVHVLLFFLIVPSVFALNIDLSINKLFMGDVKYFLYNDSQALKEFSTEFVNTGSIPYDLQVRLDVMDANGIVFTAWSPKRVFMPGNDESFVFYWLPEAGGEYLARLRFYHGGEVMERSINITASRADGEDAFDISDVRVYNNIILFSLSSREDAGRVIMVPSNFTQGWIFTQATIENMKKGSSYTSYVTYKPSVWFENSIALTAASEDGRYISSKSIKMERKTGLEAFIAQMLFGLALP